MTIPQIEDVRPILKDFEVRLRKILEDAWEDWLALPVSARTLVCKTTRANIVFDFAKHRAIAEFANDREIHAYPRGRTVKFLFRDRILVRLKKANAKGLGSNIQTQTVLSFTHPQIPLLDLPEIYHVEILYRENHLTTAIESIAATFRRGYSKVWSYELLRPEAAATVVPMPTPPPPSDDGQPATVRPRQNIEKKDEQDQE